LSVKVVGGCRRRLIASGTLRDLRNDRLIFRHDVLREWAIANFLFGDATALARLPLDHRAAGLARGVELRLACNRAHGGRDAWHSFFTALNREGVHPSWSRAVFAGAGAFRNRVRTLNKASAHLSRIAHDLRELIRIVMAVESVPAEKYYGGLGIGSADDTGGYQRSKRPILVRLILWLLKLGASFLLRRYRKSSPCTPLVRLSSEDKIPTRVSSFGGSSMARGNHPDT